MSLAHNIEEGLRTQDVRMPPNVTFDTLLLKSTTIEGLARSGFYKPSPIQLHGIPMGKCGFDLLLEAKSGTGKTAVFSIITLEMFDPSKGLQAVILAPTREIAAQICDVIKQIGSSYDGLRIEVVMGGLPIQEDIQRFKNNKVHVVVGSPGRLKHLIQDKHIDVSAVRLLVLDEADRLMDSSFQNDINYIFSHLPTQKQVIMSSATYPDATKTFINQYVQNAQHICPDSDSILLGIEQKVTLVKSSPNIVKQTKYRFEELLKILSSHPFKQCLMFCNYQARVIELHKMLKKEKWPAEQLYGKQEQTHRLGALKTLQEYKCRILISTDLAARGIDASNVDLVINFEPPYEWQTYLHRIGRAGRFGSYGKAVTILSGGQEQDKFKKMIKSIKNVCNLDNLWDDEQFCLDDDDNSETSESKTHSDVSLTASSSCSEDKSNGATEQQLPEKELVKEEQVIEMIKEVTESKPSTIQSFSNLQASFGSHLTGHSEYKSTEKIHNQQKSENLNDTVVLKPSKIQSFAELQASFASRSMENNDNKPTDSTPNNTTDNNQKSENLVSSETLQTITEYVTGMMKASKEMAASKIESFEELDQDLQNFQIRFVLKEKENNIDPPEKPPRKPENPSNTSQDRQTENANHNKYNNEYYSNVTEALRLAGLPTEFGKARDTWNQNISIKPSVNPKVQQNGARNKMQFQNTKGQSSSKSKKQHQRSQKDKQLYSQDEPEELHDCGYYSHRNDTVNSQTYSHYETDNDDDSASSIGNSSYKYFEWYRKLKLVTKQIELAIYIDELSKL